MVGLALAALGTGCGGTASSEAQAPPLDAVWRGATTAPADVALQPVLDALGAQRIYVMAGDDVLRAGLGVVDARGLRPAGIRPVEPLMSNLSGNGRRVVVGAAGVTPGAGYTDGVYEIDGRRLRTIGDPAQALYAPTIAPDGAVAAIQPDGGFSVRPPGETAWQRDPRLARTMLSAVAWDRHGNAFVVTHPNQARARIVELTRSGATRRAGSAACASAVLAAPTTPVLVTVLKARGPGRHGVCARYRARVIRPGGTVTELPRGWNPIAWAHDSSALLVSSGTTIAVWRLSTQRLTASVDLGVPVWMAAAVWS